MCLFLIDSKAEIIYNTALGHLKAVLVVQDIQANIKRKAICDFEVAIRNVLKLVFGVDCGGCYFHYPKAL